MPSRLRLLTGDLAIGDIVAECAAHILEMLSALQADAGAQVVQIFDSWASELSPQDFEIFSAPYIKQIINDVRKVIRLSSGYALLDCGRRLIFPGDELRL